MFADDYWKKYFTFQHGTMSVEADEKLYALQEVRDSCEWAIIHLGFKREQSSQPARFDAALDRYRRDLSVLDGLEQIKIEKVSLEALYKVTGARNLIDLTLTPHEALEVLNSARGDQNDGYTIALHEAVTPRSVFMRSGNLSACASLLVDAENDLKTQEYFKTAAAMRGRPNYPKSDFDKPEP